MSTERMGQIGCKLVGLIMMQTGIYEIGGGWWVLLSMGAIAWMPMRWFKE